MSNVNRNSKSYDLDNLADLVTARLTSNSRQDLEQTHQARSRPFTPHGHDQDLSRSRSRMSQFGFIDSRSTTPQLSKQNSFNNFGMFSSNTRNSFENNYNRNRHSADYMDDSDYGAYPLNRDFVRTPSVMDERALSSLGSTSYFYDNDYHHYYLNFFRPHQDYYFAALPGRPFLASRGTTISVMWLAAGERW